MDQNLQVDLFKAADLLGDGVSVVYSLTHGGSIFSAWVLSGDFAAISALPKGEMLAAIKALDDNGRKAIEDRLVSKINLPDALKAKVVQGEGLFERVVALVYKSVDLVNIGKSIVLDAEALVK